METFATLLALREGDDRDTGDLRRHRADYDISVMEWK